jgi:hypothetical protein
MRSCVEDSTENKQRDHNFVWAYFHSIPKLSKKVTKFAASNFSLVGRSSLNAFNGFVF